MALSGAPVALGGLSVGRERCRPWVVGVGGRVWGGTNVRFGVSQQTTIPVYVRDKNEPIGTHTHRVIVLRDRSMTRIG